MPAITGAPAETETTAAATLDPVERFRSSQEEYALERERGKQAGRKWIETQASFAEANRLSRFWHANGRAFVAIENSPDPGVELVSIIRPTESDQAAAFWEGILPGFAIEEPGAFFEGFAAGALARWQEIRAKV